MSTKSILINFTKKSMIQVRLTLILTIILEDNEFLDYINQPENRTTLVIDLDNKIKNIHSNQQNLKFERTIPNRRIHNNTVKKAIELKEITLKKAAMEFMKTGIAFNPYRFKMLTKTSNLYFKKYSSDPTDVAKKSFKKIKKGNY